MLLIAERTRRHVCRAGFIALCVLPTLAAICWISFSLLPSYRRNMEQALSARLGADVTVGAVRYPRPGVVRYEQVTVAEPGSHARLLKAECVEARRADARWIVTVQGAEAVAGERGLWPLLKRCVDATGAGPREDVQLSADRVALPNTPELASVSQVNVLLESRNALPHLAITFRTAARGPSPPIHFDLTGTAGGEVSLDLNTGEAALPVALAALVVPNAARMGSAATFTGRVHLEQPDAAATGSIEGRLAEVDLESLLAGLLPQEMAIRGRATLTLDSAKLQDARVAQAKGTLVAGPGRVGPRLLDAAVDSLRLKFREDLKPKDGEALAYTRLGIGFTLDPAGLRLTALRLAGTSVKGTPLEVMSGASNSGATEPWELVIESNASPLPPTALARLFSPQTPDWVPATPQSQWLLSRLPLTMPGKSVPR